MTEITIRGWHRTVPEHVDGILAEGFNLERRHCGRAWGDGTYFALHPDTLDIYWGESLITVSVTLPANRVAIVPYNKAGAAFEWWNSAEIVRQGLADEKFDAAVIEAGSSDYGPGGYQVVVRPYLVRVGEVDEYDKCWEELSQEDLGITEWRPTLLREGQHI